MLILRQVRPWGGDVVDVALRGGRVAEMASRLPPGGLELDGGGDLLLPGLRDHHVHLLALAARRSSVSLRGLVREADVRRALAAAPPGIWVRAVEYDERVAGIPDQALLDSWVPDRPLRLADRTGALRVLNSPAMALLEGLALPTGAERDATGAPNGRFWREDQWLASALPGVAPDIASLGTQLLGLGLTGLTDAGAQNGPAEARLLGGALPQRLVLMGSEELVTGAGYVLGPLKLLIDERDPPPLEDLAQRIRTARGQGRNVAAHCVTEGELALYLAALALAGGALAGDRIEHGGIISGDFIPVIAAPGLTVVTNPGFIHDRGDRYIETIPADSHGALYPAASLTRAGISLRAGSDAPYASVDPWLGMRSARDRRTAGGHVISPAERLSPIDALRLYCQGEVAAGQPADLVLCAGTLADVLSDLCAERVRATIVDGEIVHVRA